MAGPDVTQGLPTADNGVTSGGSMPGYTSREDPAAAPPPGETESDDRLEPAEAAEQDEAGSEARPAGGSGRRSGAGRKNGDAKSGTRSGASRVTRRTAQPATAPAAGQSGSDQPSGAAAVRRRLARLAPARVGAVNPVLEPLIRTVRTTHPKADIRLIERAYEAAARMHAGQSRNSGDPYITHPLAVATILAELGMPHEVIGAALLHDTVEDTTYTIDELRADFGDDIASLVDGVTKLEKVKYGESAQAETVRKMVVAMSRDIRVLVIKLADRLGMNTVKWELEDLSFATLFPKRYDEIARLGSERAPRGESYLQEVIEDVQDDLKEAKIKAQVTGRPKHYYSVYQKMIARNVSFDDIYDLVGIRVLVDSLRDCYAVLGIVHARWNPVPGRFKDYIAMPKFNMYQSLHTTVIGPEGKPVELQIRTWGMHKRAEYGVAAHWKY